MLPNAVCREYDAKERVKKSKLREKKKHHETIDVPKRIKKKSKRMQEAIYMDFVIFAPWNATQGSQCH